jgi:hypothetical protein
MDITEVIFDIFFAPLKLISDYPIISLILPAYFYFQESKDVEMIMANNHMALLWFILIIYTQGVLKIYENVQDAPIFLDIIILYSIILFITIKFIL